MTPSIADLVCEKSRKTPSTYFPQYETPPRYDFDQGMPAPETYPLADLQACAGKVLASEGDAACGYFGAAGRAEMVYGYRGLREQLAQWVTRRDARTVGAESILLANGSSAGLSMIANTFLGPGDGAVVEATTFPYMSGYMASTGATLANVPVDRHGMDVGAIAARFEQFKAQGLRPKMIYTIPTFHVPTGVLMPLQRRRELLALAREWGVLVVEDNCYHELWYDAPPPPTLWSLDDSGLVIQSDSFSKMLAPGVRTGWVTASPQAIQAIGRMRTDLGVSQLTSHMLAAWMADSRLAPHLDKVRPLYRRKRDVAAAALRRHCADYVDFEMPGGGIFFWLALREGFDVDKVRELALRDGVACRPGERFASDDSGKGYMRMSFLQVAENEIERGVEALGKAFAASHRS